MHCKFVKIVYDGVIINYYSIQIPQTTNYKHHYNELTFKISLKP